MAPEKLSEKLIDQPVAKEFFLETSRLRLREFSDTDRDSLVKMHKDLRLSEFLLDPLPLHQHRFAANFIQYMKEFYREHDGLGIWAAERMKPVLSQASLNDPLVRETLSDKALKMLSKPKVEFAGWFNLTPNPNKPKEIELGSRLMPSLWGSGLAVEGGELLLAYAFTELRQKRVWAFSHPAHRSVEYCVNVLGFKDCGLGKYIGDPLARVYKINRDYWLDWSKLPRKDRMRHAVKTCKHRFKEDSINKINNK